MGRKKALRAQHFLQPLGTAGLLYKAAHQLLPGGNQGLPRTRGMGKHGLERVAGECRAQMLTKGLPQRTGLSTVMLGNHIHQGLGTEAAEKSRASDDTIVKGKDRKRKM